MTPQWARRWARLRALLTRRPALITFAVVSVTLLVYTLAGFFLVPRLVATYVPRYVEQRLGRRAEIGEVRVNPLLLKIEIKKFRLKEADGRPLLGFDRLFVDLELASSIFRAAWTFAEIRLEAPRVEAVISADGRMNIAEMLDALPKDEPAKQPTAPPRLLVQHAVVQDGVASLTDLSRHSPQTAAVQPINIELHEITTLRERRGPYTISATLRGGGVVGWDGQVSLVPLASAGRFDLRRFPLATAWRCVHDVALALGDESRAAPLALDVGGLSLGLSARLVSGPSGLAGVADNLGLTLARVAVRSEAKTPLIALERIAVEGGRVDLGARQVAVSRVAVNGGATTVVRDASGAIPLLAALRPAELPKPV